MSVLFGRGVLGLGFLSSLPNLASVLYTRIFMYMYTCTHFSHGSKVEGSLIEVVARIDVGSEGNQCLQAIQISSFLNIRRMSSMQCICMSE